MYEILDAVLAAVGYPDPWAVLGRTGTAGWWGWVAYRVRALRALRPVAWPALAVAGLLAPLFRRPEMTPAEKAAAERREAEVLAARVMGEAVLDALASPAAKWDAKQGAALAEGVAVRLTHGPFPTVESGCKADGTGGIDVTHDLLPEHLERAKAVACELKAAHDSALKVQRAVLAAEHARQPKLVRAYGVPGMQAPKSA